MVSVECIHDIRKTRTNTWHREDKDLLGLVFSPRAHRVVISVVYSASYQRYDDLTYTGSSKVLDHKLVYCAAYVRVNEELLAVKIGESILESHKRNKFVLW